MSRCTVLCFSPASYCAIFIISQVEHFFSHLHVKILTPLMNIMCLNGLLCPALASPAVHYFQLKQCSCL